MMIVGDIMCPMCMELVGSLSFWKKVDEKHFHLCDICLIKNKSEEDLLRLAHNTGYGEGMSRCIQVLSDEQNKVLP